MILSRPILGTVLAMLLVTTSAAGTADKIQPLTTDNPVVVELYTSQGCSSCPPADSYLGDLAKRRDILALALHVDYWDYIGWKDQFASPDATQRQRAYVREMRQRMVYTPQMIIDGVAESVGSDRGKVEKLITEARARAKLPIAFWRDEAGKDWVEVGDGAKPEGGEATVYIALYDGKHETPVQRGENAGSTLTEFNIVREWRPIGKWDGHKVRYPIVIDDQDEDYEACAVIVQQGEVGPILGASAMKMELQH
jgi:hypothetical protein